MDENVSKIKRNIELAKSFECEYIDTTIFNAHNEKRHSYIWWRYRKTIKIVYPWFRKNNIDLVLELHGGYATGDRMKNIIDKVVSAIEWEWVFYQ